MAENDNDVDFEKLISNALEDSEIESENQNYDLKDDTVNIDLSKQTKKSTIDDSDEVEETVEPKGELEVKQEDDLLDETEMFKDKYYLEKKKRKSALADRQRLEYENQQLKAQLGGTVESNIKLYGEQLYKDFEAAKAMKRQAMFYGDSNDPESVVKAADFLLEADEIYNKVSHKVYEYEKAMERRAKEEAYSEIEYEEADDVDPDTGYTREQLYNTEQWLKESPEVDQNSRYYNPRIAKEVARFIKEDLDPILIKDGYEDALLSETYFEIIDEYIDKIKVKQPTEGYKTANVGSVKNNYSGADSSNKIKITLTQFDKDMAKSLKISNEEYLKYKIQDMKETNNSLRG